MDGIRIPDEPRFAKVREDVEAGRLWKARDRLHGHVGDDRRTRMSSTCSGRSGSGWATSRRRAVTGG